MVGHDFLTSPQSPSGGLEVFHTLGFPAGKSLLQGALFDVESGPEFVRGGHSKVGPDFNFGPLEPASPQVIQCFGGLNAAFEAPKICLL